MVLSFNSRKFYVSLVRWLSPPTTRRPVKDNIARAQAFECREIEVIEITVYFVLGKVRLSTARLMVRKEKKLFKLARATT